jgi:pSer/pThr/pTyr-binding forkhead associated (FHA) protein
LSTWLNAWRNRDTRESIDPVMELMVLAGEDAGNQFTVEGDLVLVGRGEPESGQTDVVRLEDKSISRRQAWIRLDSSGASLEHIESASNPTLVNGESIARAPLSVGDRIEMGRVVIEVRVRSGMNLHGLSEIIEDAASYDAATMRPIEDQTAASFDQPTMRRVSPEPMEPEKNIAGEVTDIRPMQVHIGELRIVRGVESVADTRFPIFSGTTRIGRSDEVEIQIPELGVSRFHAEISMQGRSLVLVQKSQTNATLINGFPLQDRVDLSHGDEIQLADLVVLSVHLASASRDPLDRPDESGSALSARMEHKIDLDREIEEFKIMGSFVDVDVVASRAMKGGGEKAEHIIVSFERFRAYVGGICEEWDGQILNSNGDELMCFF